MAMELVRHLLVLMLENRSFDNMVGYAYRRRWEPSANQHSATCRGFPNNL
jgi:phospholipase C